ncbi:hypothetical protein F5883DRAFT_532132 [Diaporthe sp. PMI_573]|nr:hypothetical protein F5883DRAFT_532132 [Diaporthaceae sp. PMI_573]
MHHYTSTSYLTICCSPSVQKVFQSDIPKEPFAHPFLLHQILALSAYHLAYLQPDHRHPFLTDAAKHQNNAINLMRVALTDTNSSNCHALFASSALLTLGAFATYPSQEKYDETFAPVDSLLDIFTLTVGMRTIFRTSDVDLRKGPLGNIFVRGPGDDSRRTVETKLQPLFDQLSYLNCMIAESCIPETRIVHEATLSLIDCIVKVSSANVLTVPAEFRAVFLWPGMMSGKYLSMLRKQHPAALVVLAHFCVVMRMAEPFSWFLEGWAKALMTAIFEQVSEGLWSRLLEWPSRAMAMNVSRNDEKL